MNKTCKALASEEALWNTLPPKIAFGKKQWAKYFGDIGKEPPLPKDIHNILKSPCPFWPGKKVEETHILVLIPESVNGKSLTVETLGEIENTITGSRVVSGIWDECIQQNGNLVAAQSHWVLMTKDVVKGSTEMSYPEQQAFIAEFAKKNRNELRNSKSIRCCNR